MRIGTGAALAAVMAMAAAGPAAAGVTGCKASGGKQEAGAVIGAVVGGVLGNKIAGHNKGVGTVVGAAGGAAAGSAIGCEMQKSDAEKRGPVEVRRSYAVGEAIPVAYVRDGRNQLNEPWKYRLEPPAKGYRWVVIGRDAYLVGSDSGRVKDVARSFERN